MWIIVQIVAVYLFGGILALVLIRALSWLTTGDFRSGRSWGAELGAVFWTIVSWPLLVVGGVLVAMIFVTFNRLISRLSRSENDSEYRTSSDNQYTAGKETTLHCPSSDKEET